MKFTPVCMLCGALLLLAGIPAWSQDTADTSADAAAASETITDDTANETASAADAVWWGNRSISFRNYIKFQKVDGGNCPGICKYCDRNLICCQTGCKCESCEYICDDCSECPPPYFDKIFFDLDKAVLRPDGIEECNKVLSYLESHPDRSILIEGHTCDLATDTYNVDLGRRRAEAVRRYLIERGVDASRIQTQTLGETEPWVGADQRDMNRRAVVVVMPGAAQ